MRYYEDALGISVEAREGGLVVTDADHQIAELCLPDTLHGLPFAAVGKKALLGCRLLKKVCLPETVKEVGEWAFASCENLQEFSLAGRHCAFGQGVFKNDKSLTKLRIDQSSEDSACLLAGAVITMEAEYLLSPEAVDTPEWFKQWDRKLENILRLADDEGYHLYVLCGEEDLHFDYEEYLEYTRRKKAGLCMLRLLYDNALPGDFADVLTDYIRAHSIGCASQAAWDEILLRHGNDLRYYDLLMKTGALREDNLEAALNALSTRHAEAKAFLINTFNRADKAETLFDGLLL